MSKHRFDIANRLKAKAVREQKLKEDRQKWFNERVNRERNRSDAYKKQMVLLDQRARQEEARRKAARWQGFSDEVKRIKTLSAEMEKAKNAMWENSVYTSYVSAIMGRGEPEPWSHDKGPDMIAALLERE